MPNPVVHFEINAKNGVKTQQFYKRLFQWNIDANNTMNYGMVAKGGKGGIAGGINELPSGKPFVTFYARVKSINAVLKKAKKLGAKVVMPRTVIPNMVTFAMFKDPEGNVIGIIE